MAAGDEGLEAEAEVGEEDEVDTSPTIARRARAKAKAKAKVIRVVVRRLSAEGVGSGVEEVAGTSNVIGGAATTAMTTLAVGQPSHPITLNLSHLTHLMPHLLCSDLQLQHAFSITPSNNLVLHFIQSRHMCHLPE